MVEVSDGDDAGAAAGGAAVSGAGAVAGAADGGVARGPGPVLGGGRSWAEDRGRGGEAGVSSPVGVPVVPSRWRRESLSFCRRCRAATCRSASGRRSRSCGRRVVVCGRSRGGWGAARRRSRGSCAGTRRRGRGGSSTRRRSRSGTPSVGPAGRRSPSWSRTSGSARTCRSGSRVRCALTGGRAVGPPGPKWKRSEQAASRGSPLGAGLEPGADREPAAGRLPR